MNLSPNIRKSCNVQSTSQLRLVGSCGSTFTKPNPVTTKTNVTRMVDYHGASFDSHGVDPYIFAQSDQAPICSPYWVGIGGYDCGVVGGSSTNDNFPCGIPKITDVITSGSITSSFDVGPYKNYYINETGSRNTANCKNIGYKNAFAHKYWLGRWGYTSRELGQIDNFDWCVNCGTHNIDSQPDTVKYLAMSANSSYSKRVVKYLLGSHADPSPCDCISDATCPDTSIDTDNTITATAANSFTVDRYSGNLTVGTCTSASSGCFGDTPEDIAICNAYYADLAFGLLGEADATVTRLVERWYEIVVIQQLLDLSVSPDVITGTSGNWTVEYQRVQTCLDHCDNWVSDTTRTYLKLVITPTTLDIYTYGEDISYCPRNVCQCVDCCKPWVETSHETYSYGATTFTYTKTVNLHNSVSLDEISSTTVNGMLSSPYTSDDVYNDVVGLLNHLPLGDDAVLPWRTDDQVTKGPVCYYDEHLTNMTMPTCLEDTSSSGKIYGKPAPTGIDHVWNPTHKNYCICTYTGDDMLDHRCTYVQDVGAWNDSIGGGCPTAWLNDREATSLPQGAFIGNGWFYTTPCTNGSTDTVRQIDGDFWACKYAEIIFPKPSINFFRPCGVDRFQISESTNRCITDITAGTVNLEPTGTDSNVQTNDYVWICGTTDNDGCWKVNRVNGKKFTLQEPRIVSASALPIEPIVNCGTGLFVQLKNQTLSPAICGRINVTYSPGTDVTMSLAEPSYLVDTDSIIVVSSSVSSLNGYKSSIKVIDNTTIALPGVTVSASGSAMIYSPFTPGWEWNDNTTKGEFAVLKWHFNERDVGEYYRISASNAASSTKCDGLTHCDTLTLPTQPRPHQKFWFDQEIDKMECSSSCLQMTPCSPNVAYFSPNSESFASGSFSTAVNYGWGYDIRIDEKYGSKWQGIVKQAIDDPFWVAPPCPCELDTVSSANKCVGLWKQDDGTCQEDDVVSDPNVKYYAKAPQVENRCDVPTGSPPLPDGKYLGCVTVDKFTSDTVAPKGNICWYPTANSYDMFNMPDGCDVYYKHSYDTPWVTYLNETNCVCSDGRFKEEYTNGGVRCDTNLIVPPP